MRESSVLPARHSPIRLGPFGLRWRLMADFGLTLVVMLYAFALGVSWFIHRAEARSWQEHQQEATGYAVASVQTRLENVRDALSFAGRLVSVDAHVQPVVTEHLHQQIPDLKEILIADDTGPGLAHAFDGHSYLSASSSVTRTPWFVQAAAGEPYAGTMDQPFSLLLAVPTANGKVVAARLETSFLQGAVAGVGVDETEQTYIIDREGRVIAHSDPTWVGANLSDRVGPASLFETTEDEWNGSYTNLQGLKVSAVAAAVPNTSWLAVTELPAARAQANTRNLVILLASGIACLIIALTIAARGLLGRLIFEPLEKLREGAQRMGAGDHDYRISVLKDDEIGQVAAAFNEMADSLRERSEQLSLRSAALAVEVAERKRWEDGLRVMNLSLEDRVAARTEQLMLEVNERRRAEEELRILNQELETRVMARTAELEREVKERKRAEEELGVYAEKLEHSNRELQDFAYVASHDLQEPLRKVQAFGDRLRDRCGSALNEQGLDYLSRMQNAAARMQTLIEGLLEYSRVTSKAQPFVPVDLNQVTHEVLDDLETRIDQLGATVEVKDLPVVDADPLQMRQLLQNLIGNALKFHRDGVPPQVSIHGQSLNGGQSAGTLEDAPSRMCQVHVKDNGIGFEEKYAERIFQVFQRLHGRGSYEGTGIGLAVCRKIAERHGGSIIANSSPGDGATFIITLPIHKQEGESAA